MQTFLCEPTFHQSIAHLDNKRLGKQRVEAYQILLALGDSWAWSVYKGDKSPDTYGWQNHPAVLMWRGYKTHLKTYYHDCVLEWVKRGYKNTMSTDGITWQQLVVGRTINMNWHTPEFVTSHRCKLLQKNYDFYSQYNWNVPDNWQEIDYIWPVRKSNDK